MNSKRTVSLILFLFLVSIPSINASRSLVSGNLGYYLSYTIDSPTVLKVGDDAPINFEFSYAGPNKIFVKDIWVQIWGAGINSTSFGISKRLAADIELRTFDSFNETILVKPLNEGTIACMARAEYNWTDLYGNPRDDGGIVTVYINARANTYDELLTNESIFRNLIYILSTTTIAFIATTVYLVIRKPKVKRA